MIDTSRLSAPHRMFGQFEGSIPGRRLSHETSESAGIFLTSQSTPIENIWTRDGIELSLSGFDRLTIAT